MRGKDIVEEYREESDDHVDHPKSLIKHQLLRCDIKYSPKLFLLVTPLLLFAVFQIHVFPTISFSSSSLIPCTSSCKQQQPLEKLRQSVTFLPLKDIRYAERAGEGHTWFMSTLNDTQVEGGAQHLHFPSELSKGRLLCFKGRNIHDGSWNYYALAWPEALPENATLKEGLTYVSSTDYVYYNIWHGLSALAPLAAWHLQNGCRSPARWLLYYKGELRTRVPPWLSTLMEAVYGTQSVNIEELKGYEAAPVCFEEAVVTRHCESGISREKLEEVTDLFRCKARAHCNVSAGGDDVVVRVMMLLRRGGRSFKNDTHVIGIFETECRKIKGCRLQVAYSINLTVCQQVKVMSETDVLISPHGAQMSNLIFMEKGSSVMELFPKGWLKLAGQGQNVFQWLCRWSGMHHMGTWHDTEGPPCEYPEDDRRCMSVYKNAQIGHNETRFREWARTVFNEARVRKMAETSNPKPSDHVGCGCASKSLPRTL
ncbi:hypothetical protein V2J09_014506 [Rumex salicifolius]